MSCLRNEVIITINNLTIIIITLFNIYKNSMQ